MASGGGSVTVVVAVVEQPLLLTTVKMCRPAATPVTGPAPDAIVPGPEDPMLTVVVPPWHWMCVEYDVGAGVAVVVNGAGSLTTTLTESEHPLESTTTKPETSSVNGERALECATRSS